MRKRIYMLILLILIPLVSARVIDTLEQEQTKTYGQYQLKAIYIGQERVKFQLNNMISPSLQYHDLYTFEDGSRIFIREILEEEALEGQDIVSFRFYPAETIIITEPEIMQNVSEEELPSIIQEKEIETPPPVPEEPEIPSTAPEKQSLWTRIINWIKDLFK